MNEVGYAAAVTQSRSAIEAGIRPAVMTELDSLHESIGMLHGMFDALRDRLSPVLSSSPPANTQGSGPQPAPDAPVCEIATTIRNARSRVNAIVMFINEMAGRLEV